MTHPLRAFGAPPWKGGDTWGRRSRNLGVPGLDRFMRCGSRFGAVEN
ncbi:hypothetical protein [Hydrogenophaga sp. BPS33]|nr:hypothetical protein [Hydrogenophaga sp. BPS33]